MDLVLFCAILLAWFVGLRLYGPFSFVTAGLLGFTIYSIPALLQLVYPFHSLSPFSFKLIPSHPTSGLVTLLAWLVFAAVIAIRTRTSLAFKSKVGRALTSGKRQQERSLTLALLVLCAVGYLAIAATDGLLFFLNARDEQTDTHARLLWRWVNAAGVVTAVIARQRLAAAVFLVALIVYFIAGDRTIFIVTAICIAVMAPRGHTLLRMLFRIRTVIFLLVAMLILFFGKPIYWTIKSGDMIYLEQAMTYRWLEATLTTFEPFVTFNILDLVVRYEFQMPIRSLIEGIFGQFLIKPSAFGIDSNSFNVAFTRTFAPSLHYGIAGNYWAQGWSLGGALGVSLFAMVYGVMLRVCDRGAWRYSGALRVLFALIGALIAVYAHRNSLDNLLSFVRQIIFVMVSAVLLAGAIQIYITLGKSRSSPTLSARGVGTARKKFTARSAR